MSGMAIEIGAVETVRTRVASSSAFGVNWQAISDNCANAHENGGE